MKLNKFILLFFAFIAANLNAQSSNWEIFSNTDIGIQSTAISCIIEDKDFNIWVGTFSEGIYKYDGDNWVNYNTDNSLLPSNWITSIAVDSNNVKWIGTFGNNGGLTKYDESNWRVYNLEDYGIEGNTTYDIKIDNDGTFWMGSYWQGLIEFDGDTTFALYNSSNTNLNPLLEEIISINTVMDSVILCGSGAWGAARFNKTDTFWTEYSVSNYPIDFVINDIEVDENNNIWFAGINFISLLDNNSNWTTFNYDSSYYADIIVNENNILFVSSVNDGLLKLDYSNGEEWTKIQPPVSELLNIGCDGFMKDHNGNYWIGYNNGYLAIYNPDGITDVKSIQNNIPFSYSLYQNYPNPFNPTTKIKYQIPFSETGHSQSVRLIVYDILGNEVAILVNEEKPAGNYEIEFSAAGLTSGIYFYTLYAGTFVQTKKMILLR